MPEIKNTFLKGRMNKDLDERLIPNGEYRDAMNIQISTSEGSDVGTVQNILGNIKQYATQSGDTSVIPDNCKCVGAIANERTNKLYWFIKKEFNPLEDNFEAIIEYTPADSENNAYITPVFIDTKIGTADAVLKFPERIITGINVIDDLLFWTDGVGEPKKINITNCKAGTVQDNNYKWRHTQLVFPRGSFHGCYVFDTAKWSGASSSAYTGLSSYASVGAGRLGDINGTYNRYGYIHKEHLNSLTDPDKLVDGDAVTLRHYRDGKYIRTGSFKFFENVLDNYLFVRYDPYDPNDSFNENHPRAIRVGDVFYADRTIYDFTGENDVKEEHITVIKKAPTTKLNFKINNSLKNVTTSISQGTHAGRTGVKNLTNKKPLFEEVLPRFSYRYKYVDNEYSAFAPFTDVVFNPEYKEDYTQENFYNEEDGYNTAMVNSIDSIELTDFISSETPKDVVQIDILYKKENSPIIYSIASLTHDDNEWHAIGSNSYSDIGYNTKKADGSNGAHSVYGSGFKGNYTVTTENISNALPENQILRGYDNVPRSALAQEITGNRIVYGNYVQGYTPSTKIPKVIADYNPRSNYNEYNYKRYAGRNRYKQAITSNSFTNKGLPSVKSQRNYQLGISFLDKYGRETPVFSSSESAIKIPWRSKYGSVSSSQSHQLNVSLNSDVPSFAEYIKYFVKETSAEYYNLLMDDVYVPADYSKKQDRRFIYASFPSSDRNKISEDSYIILKKKLGESLAFEKQTRFKVLDIKNEAPEFVKYQYISYGKVSKLGAYKIGGYSDYLNNHLFTNDGHKPSKLYNAESNQQIVFSRSAWQSARGMHFRFGDNEDNHIVEDNLYFSFFIEQSDGRIQRSKRYKIANVRGTTSIVFNLEEKINHDDVMLARADRTTAGDHTLHSDLVIEIEQRILRREEDFSGKFFVKLKADQRLTEQTEVFGNKSGNALERYFQTASAPSFLLYNDHSFSGQTSTSGIWNSNTAITDTEENVTGNTSYMKSQWETIKSDMDSAAQPGGFNMSGRGFFIDGMFMIAGQISDNNYAKNAGQTWNGIHTSYPENPKWVGSSLQEGIFNILPKPGQQVSNDEKSLIIKRIGDTNHYFHKDSDKLQTIDDTNVIKNGWLHKKSLSARYPSGIEKSRNVNGLEGYINQTTKKHFGQSGVRRWKKEAKSGQGLYKSDFSFDDTYGNQDDSQVLHDNVNRNFLHLSFLAPGADLCPNEIYGSNFVPSSNNFIGRYIQGVWGGGVFTNYDGTALGYNNDLYSFPLEGKTRVSTYDQGDEPPGPGVPYSVGYDLSYRELHENQWNPTYPTNRDEDGKIQDFIENIRPGAKFRFQSKLNDNGESESNTTIYTILNVSVKKLYNHTNWRATRYIKTATENNWGGNWVAFDNTLDPTVKPGGSGGNGSIAAVEDAVINYAQYIDSTTNERTGSDESDNALQFLKDVIKNFGRANNRRLCYIIETDKDIEGLDGAINDGSMTNLISRGIEFIAPISGYIKAKNTKPIVWETEPKQTTELEIYHEASDAIPVKINNITKNSFAPVGSIVEIVDFETSSHTTADEQYVFNSSHILQRWHGDNEIEIYPGIVAFDNTGTEINYSNRQIRFYKKDGSYNTALLTLQEPDPTNSKGYTKGGVDYKTRFFINQELQKDLKFGLSWYNCFSFGNGIESNRIRDGFNEMFIGNGPIVSSTIDTDYQEEKRGSGLIFSGIYNSNTTINELNQFITADKITKDLNPSYGDIQKLFSRRVGLVAFCEDRIVNIIANKDNLFNADGNPELISSTNVLGDATPFVGDYGISKNPESFAKESYRAYFTDKQRGAVLRLSMDGLTPISDAGMKDWFRDNLITEGNILGTYDEYKKEYNISLLDPNLFSTNLIENPNINEGTEVSNLTLPPLNLIVNGGIGSGDNITYPSIYTDTAPILGNNAGANNYRHLQSEVDIVNYAGIPVGHFYPGVNFVPGHSGLATQFSTTNYNIYNEDFTSLNATNLNRGYSTSSTLRSSKYYTPFTDQEVLYDNPTPVQNEGNYANSSYLNISQVLYGSHQLLRRINGTIYYGECGFVKAPSGPAPYNHGFRYNINGGRVINAINAPGLSAATATKLFINQHTGNSLNSGAHNSQQSQIYIQEHNSNVPKGIMVVTDDTQTGIIFPGIATKITEVTPRQSASVPAVFTYDYSEYDTNVDSSITQWNASQGNDWTYGAAQPNQNYTNTSDRTIFAGEEIRVEFKCETFANATKLNIGGYRPVFKVKILDGLNSVGSDIIQDITVVPAINTANVSDDDNLQEAGFIDSNEFTFSAHPIGDQIFTYNNQPTYQNKGKTKVYEFWVKFKVGNGSMADGSTYDSSQTEAMVIKNLNIEINDMDPTSIQTGGTPKANNRYTIQSLTIEKRYKMTTPSRLSWPGVASVDAIPSSNSTGYFSGAFGGAGGIPAFSTVHRRFVNDGSGINQWSYWLSSSSSGTKTHAVGALNQFGADNNSPTMVTETDPAGNTYTWYQPNPNGVTVPTSTFNTIGSATQTSSSSVDTISGTINFGPDKMGYDNPNASSWLAYTLDDGFIVGDYYLVDVFCDVTSGSVMVEGVLNPAETPDNGNNTGASGSYIFYGNTADSYNNRDIRNDKEDPLYGHFGSVNWPNGGTSTGAKRNIYTMDISDTSTSAYKDDLIAGANITGRNNQPGTPVNLPGLEVRRAVFRIHEDSYIADGAGVGNLCGKQKLRIYLWNFIGNIHFVNVANVTDKISIGSVPDWTTDRYDSKLSHQDNTIVHAFSQPTSYYDNNKLVFNNANHADAFEQKFDLLTTQTPFDFLPIAGSAYTLKFKITDYVQGKARIQLRTDLGPSGGNPNGQLDWNGLHITAEANGDYEIGNIEFSNDGTSYYLSYSNQGASCNIQTYDTLGGWTWPDWSRGSSNCNLMLINGLDGQEFTGKVSDIYLTDEANIVSGGIIQAWDVGGFDPNVDQFITYALGEISLNNADPNHFIRQNIGNLPRLTSYRVKFYYEIESGGVKVLYSNDGGAQGFMSDFVTSTSGENSDGIGYFDVTYTIDNDTEVYTYITNEGAPVNNIIFTFDNNTVGFIDNISIQRIYPIYPTQTLSYSEDTKGWVSFKSFIPENGVSLSRQYYTFKNGELYQHHKGPYNSFYNEKEESSITFVFNQNASLIKIFNTINYEGSQSSVNSYSADYLDQTIKPYNINSKEGWYVSSIATDKQEGSIDEFIEKEGKWFNYIKGNIGSSIQTSEFSFQGVGMISLVEEVEPSVLPGDEGAPAWLNEAFPSIVYSQSGDGTVDIDDDGAPDNITAPPPPAPATDNGAESTPPASPPSPPAGGGGGGGGSY